MKSKWLISTAVLTLAIGAGAATAQTADQTQRDQPSQSQAQPSKDGKPVRTIDTRTPENKAAEQTQTQTQTKTPERADSSAGDKPAQQSTSDSQAPAATSNAPASASSTQQPSPQPNTAQTATPPTKPGETTPQQNNTAQGTAPRDANRPAAAQSAPTTQPPSAASNARAPQPATAQQPANNRDAANAGAPRQLSASLQTEQRTRLSREVTRLDARPITNVNFSITVGTAVPRSVSLRPLPTTIVSIIPQYRGYSYFVARDEIVIVEPGTTRIVDVIDRRGGPSQARSTTTTTQRKVNLSSQQRDYLREHSTRRTTTTTTGAAPRVSRRVVVGDELPDEVEIESFPEEVYREVPTVRSYRYIRGERGIYLVDPQRRTVIEDLDD